MQDRIVSKRSLKSMLSLSAAVSLVGATNALAAPGDWQDPAAAAGATISVPANTTPSTIEFTVASPLTVVDGMPIRIGATAVGPLTQDSYFYIVGQGSTPASVSRFRLSATPGGPALNGTLAAAVVGVPTNFTPTNVLWHTASNWDGGAIPNGVGAVASFNNNAGPTPITAGSVSQVFLHRDATVGAINFDGTRPVGMAINSTIRWNAGPTPALTFATPAGSPGPKITISNSTGTAGQSLSLSENRYVGTANSASNGGNGARLVIAGTQGLTIENNNPIQSIATITGPVVAATSSVGAFRFSHNLDWSRFSGDLNLTAGAFAGQGPSNAASGNTPLPMNVRVVLGTTSTRAQLESPGNNGLINIRGLDGAGTGTNASTIINHSTGSGPVTTLGSFSRAGETYTYNGNIGIIDSSTTYNTNTVPHNLRLVKTGASTQELLGYNTFFNTTASMVFHGGTLSLGSTGTVGIRDSVNPLSATAQGTVTVGTYPAFTGTAATNVIFRNGELHIAGNSAGDRIQAVNGVLTFKTQDFTSSDTSRTNNNYGYSTISLDASSAGSLSTQFVATTLSNRNLNLTSGSANGSTVLFRGTALGTGLPGAPATTNIRFTTAPTNAANGYLVSIGGTGSLGGFTAPVLRGALADTTHNGGGMGFATYDPTGSPGAHVGVRLLNASEQDTTAYPGANSPNNIRMNLAGGSPAAVAGVTTNTLQLDNTNTGGTPSVVTFSNTTLNPKNGLLFSGNAPITLAGSVPADALTGTAVSDNEDVIIHSISRAPVTVAIQVSNPGLAGSGNAARPGWITYSGSGDFTITGTQTIGNGGGLALNSTGTTTLNGDIAAANNAAHQFAISRGTVVLGSSFRSGTTISATNPNLNLVVASGALLNLNGVQTQFDALNNNALVSQSGGDNFSGGEINNPTTSPKVELRLMGVNNAAGTAGIYTGIITGNLDLVVAKTNGSQRLANANTYTGNTFVNKGANLILTRYGSIPATDLTLGESTGNTLGILTLGDVGGTNGAVNQTVANLANLGTGASYIIGQNGNMSVFTVNNSSANTYSGAIHNNITLRKTNSGTLTLAGTTVNTYVGGTIIEGGTLAVGADSKLGTVGAYILSGTPAVATNTVGTPNTPQVNNIILNGGTLQTTATFTLNSLRGVGVGPTEGLTGGTGGINVDGGTVLTYAGNIANAGNSGSNTLNKTGNGTLLLNGTNTMTGTINVNAGTLGGSGVVAAAVNVNAGGILAPGTSPGTFTINNAVSLNPASSLGYELLGTDPTVSANNDLTTGITNLILDGTLNVTEVTVGSFLSATAGNKWRIFNYTGTLTDNTLALGAVPALSGGLFFSIDTSTANQVNLLVQAIPEPTSLMVLGAAGLVALRRRRA
jgi:autotransporter-associated beta strand protein